MRIIHECLQIVIWFRWTDNQGVKVWSSGIISIAMEKLLEEFFEHAPVTEITTHDHLGHPEGLDEGLAICAVGCRSSVRALTCTGIRIKLVMMNPIMIALLVYVVGAISP